MPETDVLEHFAATETMDTVISERVIRDVDARELIVHRREWVWNYRREAYTPDRQRYEFELEADGETVVHTGEDWTDYARRKIGKAVDARRLDPSTITETE